jgi:Zn-dependent protease
MHFVLAGVPVRIHPLFWLATLLLGARLREPVLVFIWVACVFVSILVHEFGHALAIRRFGWDPRIVLYHFGGLAAYEPTVSYHYNYNPNESSTRAKIMIAAAGPLAGFVLAAILIGVLFAIRYPVHVSFGRPELINFDVPDIHNYRLLNLIYFLLYINIFWGLLNLLPVYPLDGGQIARELFEKYEPHEGTLKSLWLSVITGGAVAVLGFLWFDEFWDRLFVALLFGSLAYFSYLAIRMYRGGGYGGSGGYGGYGEDRDW